MAIGTMVGNDNSRSTWSATPPMHLGVIPFCLAIPPKNGQSVPSAQGSTSGHALWWFVVTADSFSYFCLI